MKGNVDLIKEHRGIDKWSPVGHFTPTIVIDVSKIGQGVDFTSDSYWPFMHVVTKMDLWYVFVIISSAGICGAPWIGWCHWIS